MVWPFVMKLIDDGMDFLGLWKFLFGNKSSSCCSSTSKMESARREDSEPAGLKALTGSASHLNPSCISRVNILSSSSMVSSSSSSSSSTLCKPNKKKKTRKEFPPPIHLLARTGKAACHMPWVLRRRYVDGRLILHEVPVKHHEYFKAQRSEGRLVLRMMYVDDNQLHPPDKSGRGENDADRNDGPSTSARTVLEKEEEERQEKNPKTDNHDHHSVDNDAAAPTTSSSSTTSLIEEDGLETNKTSNDRIVNHITPSTSFRPSNVEDGLDDAKSDDDVRNGLDVKYEKKVEIPAIDHHRAIKKVLNESRLYSSSMPEGRVPCLPKDFLRIGTPTIRPIYS